MRQSETLKLNNLGFWWLAAWPTATPSHAKPNCQMPSISLECPIVFIWFSIDILRWSLEWIWQELKNVYQITHRGKGFLSIVDIKWDSSTMSATSEYKAYCAKIIGNLKPIDTVVKWETQPCKLIRLFLLLSKTTSWCPSFNLLIIDCQQKSGRSMAHTWRMKSSWWISSQIFSPTLQRC